MGYTKSALPGAGRGFREVCVCVCVCGGGGGDKLFTTKKCGEIHQAELDYPGKLKMEAMYSILLGKRQVCIYDSIRVVRYDYSNPLRTPPYTPDEPPLDQANKPVSRNHGKSI